jgi:hypothetical protein
MQKYGLKNLVVEWGASIIKSVRKYRDEDSYVNAFGKVL